MRTGLYVFTPSTVTIQEHASASPHLSGAASASIMSYRQQGVLQPIGTLHLEAGIYQVLSTRPVQITGDDIEVVVTTNVKDDWPDPKPRVLALEPGATTVSVSRFFSTALDASPDE